MSTVKKLKSLLCGTHVQLESCDPCELQGSRQCCHELPMTLSVLDLCKHVCGAFFFVFSLGSRRSSSACE